MWLLGERMTARKLLGLALGMAGMALLLAEEFANLAGAPLGALLVLGAASTWALGTVLQKKYPVRAPVAALHRLDDAARRRADLHRRAAVRGFQPPCGDVGLWPALAVAYNVLFSFAWAHWAWIKLATSVSVTVFSLAMLMIAGGRRVLAACCSSASARAGSSSARSASCWRRSRRW